MPSMVVTSRPCNWATSTLQLFTALPPTWTVQAPQLAVSQPTCVPVRRRCSRRKLDSRVSASTSAATALPLTVSSMGTLMRSLLEPRMGMRGVALDCIAEAAAAAKMADLLNGKAYAEGGARAQARSLLWQLRDAGKGGEYKVLIGRGGLRAAGRLALCALVLLL